MPIRLVSVSLFLAAIYFVAGYSVERSRQLKSGIKTDEDRERLKGITLRLVGGLFLLFASSIQLYRSFKKSGLKSIFD